MTPSPVALAVESLRASAVERARTHARELAQSYLARYAADPSLGHYPRNTGCMTKKDHDRALNTYHTIRMLTVTPEPNEPDVRRPDPVLLELFVTRAAELAESQYTAFVLKLESKVGPCDSAELLGDHVWGYSVLRVTKGDTVERWRTHQIINVSKHGLPFNQWPTRRVTK